MRYGTVLRYLAVLACWLPWAAGAEEPAPVAGPATPVMAPAAESRPVPVASPAPATVEKPKPPPAPKPSEPPRPAVVEKPKTPEVAPRSPTPPSPPANASKPAEARPEPAAAPADGSGQGIAWSGWLLAFAMLIVGFAAGFFVRHQLSRRKLGGMTVRIGTWRGIP